jgi:hypothetical protein
MAIEYGDELTDRYDRPKTHLWREGVASIMIHDAADSPGSLTPDELRQEYEAELRATIEELGVETVAERSGVSREVIETIAGDETGETKETDTGASSDLELIDAAAILATREGMPDAETIAAEARDVLLMGMTTAVLDVDTLESEVDGQIEAKEIQQKIEGRFPMTLSEYALLQQRIEGRST